MKNVITLGKVIGLFVVLSVLLLLLFVLFFLKLQPLKLTYIQKNTRNELARPVMGTIFLVIVCIVFYGTFTRTSMNYLDSVMKPE